MGSAHRPGRGVLAVALAGCTSADAGSASPAPLTLAGTQVSAYPAGQFHTRGTSTTRIRPVGGELDPARGDCTGTVYPEPIRPENAVHPLEHGAVWVSWDPVLATAEEVDTLTALVSGSPGLMLSPYPDQGATVSLQAWDHQVQVPGADDARVTEFVDLLVFNPETTPEPGAACENPLFLHQAQLPA